MIREQAPYLEKTLRSIKAMNVTDRLFYCQNNIADRLNTELIVFVNQRKVAHC